MTSTFAIIIANSQPIQKAKIKTFSRHFSLACNAQVLFEYASDYLLTGSYDVQTPGYRAPEALLRCSFSENIDVWSIGVVLVELLMSERLVPEGAEDAQAVGFGDSLRITCPRHAVHLTYHARMAIVHQRRWAPPHSSQVLPILSRLLGRLPCPATT